MRDMNEIRAKRQSSRFQNLTGNKYGRLTVLGLDSRNQRGEYKWLCRCDCGTEKAYLTTSFKYGKTTSCGCWHKEVISGENNYQAKRSIEKHGGYISSNDAWYDRAGCLIRHAKKKGVPVEFESAAEFALYLKSVAPEACPVFGELLYKGTKDRHIWSPSVDKIIPEKGYVRGNIQIISWLANAMKRDATPSQLVKFAVWALRSVLGGEVKILWRGEEL